MVGNDKFRAAGYGRILRWLRSALNTWATRRVKGVRFTIQCCQSPVCAFRDRPHPFLIPGTRALVLAVESKALPGLHSQLWCLCTTLVLQPLLRMLLGAIALVLMSRGTERKVTWCTPESRIKSCASPASLRVAMVRVPMHTYPGATSNASPMDDFQCDTPPIGSLALPTCLPAAPQLAAILVC